MVTFSSVSLKTTHNLKTRISVFRRDLALNSRVLYLTAYLTSYLMSNRKLLLLPPIYFNFLPTSSDGISNFPIIDLSLTQPIFSQLEITVYFKIHVGSSYFLPSALLPYHLNLIIEIVLSQVSRLPFIPSGVSSQCCIESNPLSIKI